MSIKNTVFGAVMFAVCGTASASVITFENDGTFNWIPSVGGDLGNGLDITQDANQSGAITANTFEWFAVGPASSDDVGYAQAYSSGSEPRMMMGSVDPGEMIGPSSEFVGGTELYTYTFSNYPMTWLGPYPNLGVKIEIGGQEHYGWIRLQWTGNRYDPIEWAYETEPGVPIMATAIPTPASLAPLAVFGAIGLRRRR